MSRVAKIPVVLGKGVEAKIENGFITVKGPKGTLSQKLNPVVEVTIDNGEVHFKAIEPTKFSNAMSGTLRALVNSMNIGVTEGFTKKLNLVGVGYKAQAQGNVLNLSLGFSHPVAYKMPEGIEVKTPTPTEIVIHGATDCSVPDCGKVTLSWCSSTTAYFKKKASRMFRLSVS